MIENNNYYYEPLITQNMVYDGKHRAMTLLMKILSTYTVCDMPHVSECTS